MITYKSEISIQAYNDIRLAVGWKVLEPCQAQTGLKNSAYLTVAWNESKPIGMARVISDGGYIALIVDVMVLPEYQGQGIGRKLLSNISSWLDTLSKDGRCIMVNLMSTPGNEAFYEKFGFERRPNPHMGAGMVRWIHR